MSAAAARPDLSVDQQQLYGRTSPDGTTRTNREIRDGLGWEPARYWAVRDSLIDLGLVFAGPGKGGTVRRANLSVDQQQLYDLVPADGSTAPNAFVRNGLEWNDKSRYWAVRDSLIDLGLVLRGPGQGGTVRRTLTPTSAETVTLTVTAVDGDDLDFTIAADQVVAAAERAVRREHTLYDPMIKVLEHEWADDHRANFVAVEMTARGGGRRTGTWSRPDLVTVEVKTHKYVPGKTLNVTTFEVKPADAINVQAVYEALAHRRSATHSYVLLYVPEKSKAIEESVDEVRRVCRFHGIGLITTGEREEDYTTWNELEPALRHEPDVDRLEEFINNQLSDHTKESILEALDQ